MNIVLTLLGWLAWNGFEFNMKKNVADDKDEAFPIGKYVDKKWDDWLMTLIVAALLLVIGHMGLGLDLLRVIDSEHPAKWSDLYYAGSGVFYEALKFAYEKWKGKQ